MEINILNNLLKYVAHRFAVNANSKMQDEIRFICKLYL